MSVSGEGGGGEEAAQHGQQEVWRGQVRETVSEVRHSREKLDHVALQGGRGVVRRQRSAGLPAGSGVGTGRGEEGVNEVGRHGMREVHVSTQSWSFGQRGSTR